MVEAKFALPRWFVFLRLLFYVTIALFALSLLYIVPWQLTVRADTPIGESEFAKWIFGISGVAFLTGMVLCVISLVALIVAQFVYSRRQPAPDIPWKRLRWPALLATIAAVVTFLDVLLSPSVQADFL